MMRHSIVRLLLAFALLPRLAFGGADDDVFMAAREAFRVGDNLRLARLVGQLHGGDLDAWVRYWYLRGRLDDDNTGVKEYLASESGSYLAEKLRADWLRLLGKRGQWDIFQQEYPKLVQPDQELVCYSWQGQLARQQDTDALDEARSVWFSAIDLPDACTPLMDRLVTAKRLTADDVWQRIRRLLEAGNWREARDAARYLTAAPDTKTLETVANAPARYLDRKLPKNFAATRLGREMALYAVQRLARQDPEDAAAHWGRIQSQFGAEEQAYAWGQLAMQAAKRHMPEALSWYALADDAALTREQMEWRVRAALRAGDWKAVTRAIGDMPPQLAAQPDWTYWRGRALAAQGKPDEARALYVRIADQPSFYGNLAADELGRPVTVPPRAAPPTSTELAQAAANPGVRRALALIQRDVRIEGVREWNWTVRSMDDRQLLATAEIARRNDIYDRAIFTAERTIGEHDYSLRYLAPYREAVEPKAKQLDLSGGWVYGLMRQESRFIMSAHSGAGAKGLMQIMPATAKWVARKIGLSDYRPGRMSDMDINVTLGTHYLKMVLSHLDNYPVLACAAYNAGPGRARRWVGTEPIEGAIYAETIPFSETRDYVKKVMSNSVYYSLLFDEKPQSLKSRLGILRPHSLAAADDLP